MRLLITCLVFILIMSGPLSGDNAANAAYLYTDLPQTHWASQAINSLSQKGIVNGYPDGTFKPDNKITREQFAVVLVKTLEIPLKDEQHASQIFWDIRENHRSFLYIDAAKPYIPVPDPKGYAFNFYPDKPITREEVAEAIVLALRLDKAQKPDSKYLAAKFKDYNNISPKYRENVAIAAFYGILSGDSRGHFNSKTHVTRAELCVLLDNVIQQKSTIDEGFEPAKKPWTLQFMMGHRPDLEMVLEFPKYNKIQTFKGTITSKVTGFNNSHLVVSYQVREEKYAEDALNQEDDELISVKYVTKEQIYVFLSDKEMNNFNIGDSITVYYDRDNNITSHVVEKKK